MRLESQPRHFGQEAAFSVARAPRRTGVTKKLALASLDDSTVQRVTAAMVAIGAFGAPSLGKVIPRNVASGTVLTWSALGLCLDDLFVWVRWSGLTWHPFADAGFPKKRD